MALSECYFTLGDLRLFLIHRGYKKTKIIVDPKSWTVYIKVKNWIGTSDVIDMRKFTPLALNIKWGKLSWWECMFKDCVFLERRVKEHYYIQDILYEQGN